MEPKKIVQGGAGAAIGVVLIYAWNIHAAQAGLPEASGEVGAAAGAVVAPIWNGILEVLGAVKDRLVEVLTPNV